MAEPLLHTSTEGQVPHLRTISRRQDVIDSAEEVYVFIGSLRPFWGRALLYIVLLFVVVALVWAWQSKVDVVASAPFRLVPLGNMQTVQSPRGGEIEVIDVKEGDQIEKGQVLFKLRSWETWQDLRALEQAQIVFQKAEYDLKHAFPKKKKLAQETILTLEQRLQVLEAVREAHQEAIKTYRNVRGETQVQEYNSQSDLQAQIEFRNAEIEHLKQQFIQQQKLFKRQLISQADMERTRVQYLGGLASLPGRMAEIYKQDMVLQDLKHQILENRVSLEREAAQMKHAYESAQLQLNQAQQKTDRILEAESDLVVAPVDGIVTQVLLNTPGQVITKGQPLVTLAPKEAPMVAEVMVLNKDVGLLKVGQVVKLKYDAFAFQDFGIQRGWLKQISPDAMIDERIGPVFRGIVELEEAEVMINGRAKPLMFGLKGVAEVVTNRQSILFMLLSPLRQLYESSTYQSEMAITEHVPHTE